MSKFKDSAKLYFVFDIIILLSLIIYFFVFWEKGIYLGGGENYAFLGRDVHPYLWDSSANYGRLNSTIVNLFINFLNNSLVGSYVPKIFMILFYFGPFIIMRLLLRALLNVRPVVVYLTAALYALNPFRILYPLSVPYVMFYTAFPLIFYLSIGIIYRGRYVYYLLLFILFNILTPISSNIALYVLCYLVFPFVDAVYMMTKLKLELKPILYYFALALSVFLINTYWVYLVVDSLLISFKATNSGSHMFNALQSGYYFDFFRMLGSWSWYSGHNTQPYYTASSYYQLPIVIIASYLVVVTGFLAYPLFKSIKKSLLIKDDFLLLVYTIPLVGIFLVLGTKEPFGFLYDLVYRNTIFLKPYREPFTKFMPIYSLGFSIIYAVSAQYLLHRFRKKGTTVLFTLIVTVFVYIAPVVDLKGLLNDDRWNAGQWSSIIKVPNYWEEFISAASPRDRYLLLPSRGYGNSYNWLRGASMVWPYPEIATNLQILRKTDTLSTEGDAVVNSLYKNKIDNIGFFNVSHILYQSDFEFRYSDPENIESGTERILRECTNRYGEFDQKYLEKILNEETDDSIRNELYVKLLDRPALCVFAVNEESYLPIFYVPKNIIYATGRNEDVVNMRDVYRSDIRSVYKINQDLSLPHENKYCPTISYGQVIDEEPEINLDALTWNKGWIWPEVDKKPGTARYSVMMFSEKLRLFSAVDKMVHTDYEIWNSSKRVQEILEFNLTGDARLKNIARFRRGVENAFSTLRNTYDEYSVSTKPIAKINPDTYWGLVKKLYAYTGVSINLLSSRTDISYSEISDSVTIFDELTQWIDEVSQQKGCKYVFDIPKEGNYELFTKETDSWRKLGSDTFDIPSRVEFGCTDLTSSVGNKELVQTSQLDLDDIAKFQQVKEWEANAEYAVSFDYLSSTGIVEVGVYEDTLDYSLVDGGTGNIDWFLVRKGEFPIQRREIFNEEILGFAYCVDKSQPCYSHFEKIFRSSPESRNGYIFIKTPVEAKEHKSSILVKNLSIKKRFVPIAAYVQKGECADNGVTKISYTRVNPTKFIINVSGATKTFDLVFQENFHGGWRIYNVEAENQSKRLGILHKPLVKISDVIFALLSQPERQQVDSKNFFNGDIVERGSNDVLFDDSTLDTWGRQSLFSETHYIANGFANAWVVDPSVIGKEDFTLVVEFWPQRLFYVCSFAALTLFVISAIYVVVLLIRKHEKKNK